MGGVPPLVLAAPCLLPRRGARAPRAWRCPCPPGWREGLRLGAALDGEPVARSHAPIAPASPRVWGRPRMAGAGRSAGVGAVAGGLPGRVCAGRHHFSGRRGEAPSRGGGRVCQPLAVPARLGWAAPCLRAPVPAVPPRRGAPGCEHLQPLRAAPESAASASEAGRAGPRFGAGRNCEAKSRKQSGALERTEGSRLARAAAV